MISKHSPRTVNNVIFFPGWNKLCNIVGKVKNPKLFFRGVILRNRFSTGNFPGWFQLGYWDRVLKLFVVVQFSSLKSWLLRFESLKVWKKPKYNSLGNKYFVFNIYICVYSKYIYTYVYIYIYIYMHIYIYIYIYICLRTFIYLFIYLFTFLWYLGMVFFMVLYLVMFTNFSKCHFVDVY